LVIGPDFSSKLKTKQDVKTGMCCYLWIDAIYVSHWMLIIPCVSSDLNSGSPVRRGQLLIIAKAAAKESAYEIG